MRQWTLKAHLNDEYYPPLSLFWEDRRWRKRIDETEAVHRE